MSITFLRIRAVLALMCLAIACCSSAIKIQKDTPSGWRSPLDTEEQRYLRIRALLPEGSAVCFVTESKMISAYRMMRTRYFIAPLLITEDKNCEYTVGYCPNAQCAEPDGTLVADFGEGAVLFRRGKAK